MEGVQSCQWFPPNIEAANTGNQCSVAPSVADLALLCLESLNPALIKLLFFGSAGLEEAKPAALTLGVIASGICRWCCLIYAIRHKIISSQRL